MNDESYYFRCDRFVPNSDGSVRHYVLEVIDVECGESQSVFVIPHELASHISMVRRQSTWTSSPVSWPLQPKVNGFAWIHPSH